MFDKKFIDALTKGFSDNLKTQQDIINDNLQHLNENQRKEVLKLLEDVKSNPVGLNNAQDFITDIHKKFEVISKIK